MAQVIKTTENQTSAKSYRTYGKKETPKNDTPLFRKTNYILMGIGAVVLFIGYLLLRGGGSEDPNQFSEAIFDARRLNVAPITILIGLVTEIFAIMWRPRIKNNDEQQTSTEA